MDMFDKLTIEIDYREALRLYLVLARVNGPSSIGLWLELKALVDPEDEIYNLYSETVPRDQTLNYNSYYKPFEKMLFSPKKSPEQIQLDKVMDQIAELTTQANKLKEVIENK